MKVHVPRREVGFSAGPLQTKLAGRRGRDGSGAFALGRVHEIFKLFAGLEEGDLFCRHFHLFPGFRIAPYSAATLASTEAAKAANLDLFPFLQGSDNAFENSLDDRFGLLAWELRNAQNLFNEVGLGQCGLLGHRPVASSVCLENGSSKCSPVITFAHDAKRLRRAESPGVSLFLSLKRPVGK